MLTYDSAEDLRHAVERKLRRSLDDDIWQRVGPEWAGPYDPGDVKEILGGIWELDIESGNAPMARKKRGRRRKDAGQTDKMKNLELLHWKFDWLSPSFFSDTDIERIRPLLRKYRETIGLSEPVPLDKLKTALMELGATESPPGNLIFYPERPADADHVDVRHLYYRHRDVPALQKVCQLAHVIADGLRLQPAEALALILCDIRTLHRGAYPRVYREGERITIQVTPGIKPRALARLYSDLRSRIVRETRGSKGKTARPRQASERVRELLRFSMENRELKGEALLAAWNEAHPDWRYGSSHSLSVVISREAKKELEEMKLGVG